MSKKEHRIFTQARKHKLSPRESQIVARLATGEKRDAVASELKISPSTVDTYLHRAFSKLGIRNITAVIFFLGY